ncbi:MAG: hypothetical protein GC180_02900 [Bacteroidetes bacterium]|nr:hypothetical protein [Bacteroidota bacterium]
MNRIKHILPALFALIITFQVANAQEEWRPGKYMQQAVDHVREKAELATSFGDYGYSEGFCFLGAYIRNGKSVTWRTTLPTGKQLLFIGGGDNDATDVDIKIYDDNGKLLAEDNDADNSPVLKFRSNTSQTYKIELRLYKSESNGSFCCLSFLEEDAPSLPMKNMHEAMKNVIDFGIKVNDEFDVRFHDLDNQWCLFGLNQESGAYNSCYNLSLGTESHIFMAAGDDRLKDSDLYLLDADDNVLEKDVSDDAIPAFKYKTDADLRYKLKLKNVKSEGNSMTIMLILTQ